MTARGTDGTTLALAVAKHYTAADLAGRIRAALAGIPAGDAPAPEVLAAVDEFHMGGRQATLELFEQVRPEADQHVVDIGSGLGGTARCLAIEYGCRVTGLDLTPAYVDVARELTRFVGLHERVSFGVANATRLPYPAHSFDGASMLHVGMNIPDKGAVFREVGRVLRPGGFFAVYDVMRTGSGEPAFPVPWAAEPEISFLESPEAYRGLLEAAGFEIGVERSLAQLALEFFRAMGARVAERGPPPLGLHLLMGETAGEKVTNMVSALEAGNVAPVQMIGRLPESQVSNPTRCS